MFESYLRDRLEKPDEACTNEACQPGIGILEMSERSQPTKWNRTEHKTVREKNDQCPQSTASHRPERARETVEATRKEREREHFSLVCKVLSCSVSSRSEERREENTTKRTRKKKVGQSGGDQPVGQSDAKISFFLSSRVIGALGPARARSAVFSPSMKDRRPEGDP